MRNLNDEDIKLFKRKAAEQGEDTEDLGGVLYGTKGSNKRLKDGFLK